MSSSDRRTFLTLGAASALAACGFTPAFGPQGSAAGIMRQIDYDDPTDKNAFDLVERLEERLGRGRGQRFRLAYEIGTESRGIVVTPDNATTRYTVNGEVAFRVTSTETGAVLTRGTVATFTSYSAAGSTVATVTGEEDAYRRLMRLLADQMVTRLIATSAEWAG